MKQLSLAARFYVTVIVAVAGVILCTLTPGIRFEHPWVFALLFTLSCASAAMKISLPLTTDVSSRNVSSMSVSYAVDFVSLLLLGLDQTLLIAGAGAFSQSAWKNDTPRPLHRTLFSVSTLIITVTGAGLAFTTLQMPGNPSITALAQPLVGAASAYFLLNSGMVALAIALTSRQPVIKIWKENFLWSAPSYFVGAGAAAIAAWTFERHEFWLAPLTFAPIYLTYRTYRIYLRGLEAQKNLKETSDLHLATIEALAAAIDAKDQMTRVHIRRVQAYAGRLAEAIKLPPGEVQAVRTAALLHDIGKLAIPAQILSKPGPLTPEEFAKVRIHPQIGAEIVASIPFPYAVAPIVLSHHERWDGTGYPQALKGEAIPIGARILAVVDYFDVITSERHNGQSLDNALALMKHEAGRALDPALVDLFVEKLPKFARIFDAENTAAPADQGRTAPATLASREVNAFENIALAHQEIYALYEIAQTMGTTLGVADTMGLIASKLRAIIPWAGCALMVQDGDSGDLICRFAVGVDAPLLLRGRLRVGEGLSGWVARHRRTLVNASPRIEFEAAGVPSPSSIMTAIVCPLELGDRFIGTLALFHTEQALYTEDHRRVLARVGEQAAAVVNNALLFEQTQEESLTDPLTGLPNRRSMMARLSSEISRSERAHSQLAVIVLDVDGFKRINDSLGHAVGDQVLREIAQALLQSLRPYDLCVRFAGDEFVIVLGDCTPEAAETKRLELQERIDAISIKVDSTTFRAGASAGVANYPLDGDTYEALLATADRRMYSDKALRRRIAGTLLPSPAGWPEEPAAPAAGREPLASSTERGN